jgi:transcriptional regulator with XRE-family HTH domain
VIDVALLGIIRRWHLRDHVSLREISKRLGISRNTVRRYLRAETVEPAYADRRSPTSLDKYAFKLSAWLKTEATKSRKQRRSLKQMHIDLCALGFEGSYDRVAAFARQWKVDQLERVNSASKSTHLLNFIQDVASHGAVADLLGGAGEIPPEFKELLEEKVAPGAAGNKSALDDYREFFEFEIEILREDSETGKSKAVGKLSKRLGSGSGGEHRAPLYVIAGAALASAYRLDDGHRDGMGLILLDEAFNKMDITNITATMRYLEDLGLQVVLASPGENLGILTAYLHRYYEILRDPVANVVDLEGRSVSEETRLAYRKDLPEFNPELIEAELRVIELVKPPAGELSVAGG